MIFRVSKLFGVDFGQKLNKIGNEIQLDSASNLRKVSSSSFGIPQTLIQYEILRLTQYQWHDIHGVRKNTFQIGI